MANHVFRAAFIQSMQLPGGKCQESITPENNVRYTVEPQSLIRSTTGLAKSDLNGEVTILQGVTCIVEYNFGLSKGDRNGDVTL